MNAVPEASSAVHEGVLELQGPLPLHFGGHLEHVSVAWRLVGDPAAPVVAALGGISAGKAVTDYGVEKGWWRDIIGPGQALDSNRYRILGIDFLGGSGGSTGPQSGQSDFPSVASQDQAEVLRRVIEHLKLAPLAAIVGASYGGMVALAFAERWPQLVKHIVVISAAHRSHPMSTAWRSVQRNFVCYAIGHGEGEQGLVLARALAMTTYRSIREFEERFAGEPERRPDGRFVFPAESYIVSRGEAYAKTYRPEAFVCLSESIDLHRVEPERVVVPMTLVAVREDQLVPIADMRTLRDRMAGPCQLIEISSVYGHDAFLKEAEVLRDVFHQSFD
jgi:homoserine O-acetyltransferase